ncbi:hypothetical protein JB92DRAFT_2836084 [Gautieria morchelliformis]|nr:hypothetical protein JB92DRAFT_2836084 [Gautieria morchelliformis]
MYLQFASILAVPTNGLGGSDLVYYLQVRLARRPRYISSGGCEWAAPANQQWYKVRQNTQINKCLCPPCQMVSADLIYYVVAFELSQTAAVLQCRRGELVGRHGIPTLRLGPRFLITPCCATNGTSIFDGQSTWPQSSFGTEYTTSQENPIIRHEEAHGESASSDSAERNPRGSSQENLTASVRPGLVSQASIILSKVVGSSVSSAMGASKRGKP